MFRILREVITRIKDYVLEIYHFEVEYMDNYYRQ